MRNDKQWSISVSSSLQETFDNHGTPPLIVESLTGILTWHTRNETTVEKAIRASGITPQFIASLLAMGASVTCEGGKELPIEVFLQHRDKEKLAAINIYSSSFKQYWSKKSVARTPADTPIVAAISFLEMNNHIVQNARIALTGVWQEPARLAKSSDRLVGSPLNDLVIRAVSEAIGQEISPKGDFLGSEEYRRAMASVLTRRSLEMCMNQASLFNR